MSSAKVFEPVLRSSSGTGMVNPAGGNSKSSSVAKGGQAKAGLAQTMTKSGVEVNSKLMKKLNNNGL